MREWLHPEFFAVEALFALVTTQSPPCKLQLSVLNATKFYRWVSSKREQSPNPSQSGPYYKVAAGNLLLLANLKLLKENSFHFFYVLRIETFVYAIRTKALYYA